MGELTDKIAALTAEVERLKAAQPAPYDPAAGKRWDAEMHELAERRASRMGGFSREDLRAMEQACPTATMRGIVADNRAPQGPSSQGAIPSSQQVSNVRGLGGPSGWAREIPLGPSPHQRYVDRQLDAQDAKDRHERMVAEAQRLALMKAAEKP